MADSPAGAAEFNTRAAGIPRLRLNTRQLHLCRQLPGDTRVLTESGDRGQERLAARLRRT